MGLRGVNKKRGVSVNDVNLYKDLPWIQGRLLQIVSAVFNARVVEIKSLMPGLYHHAST
jgi:hypothetical protein